MFKKFIGSWESDVKDFDKLSFTSEKWIGVNDEGKWAIQENEIWLIGSDLKTCIKWFFDFVGDDKLIFYNPEDFHYQGGGNYLYLQFTHPETRIVYIKNK